MKSNKIFLMTCLIELIISCGSSKQLREMRHDSIHTDVKEITDEVSSRNLMFSILDFEIDSAEFSTSKKLLHDDTTALIVRARRFKGRTIFTNKSCNDKSLTSRDSSFYNASQESNVCKNNVKDTKDNSISFIHFGGCIIIVYFIWILIKNRN